MSEIIKTIRFTVESVLGVEVHPSLIPGIEEGVIYEFSPEFNNGAISYGTVQFRFISKRVEKVQRMQSIVNKTLLQCGDGSKVKGLKDCYVSGGGMLYDPSTQTHNLIAMYRIYFKSEVN